MVLSSSRVKFPSYRSSTVSFSFFQCKTKSLLKKSPGDEINGDDDEEMKMRSTKEDAYHLCTVHEVVTVLHGMRFHGLDAILDRPGTFCLDLMCSVFLTRELVSVL